MHISWVWFLFIEKSLNLNKKLLKWGNANGVVQTKEVTLAKSPHHYESNKHRRLFVGRAEETLMALAEGREGDWSNKGKQKNCPELEAR